MSNLPIYTVDLETYYDKDYSISKITTEAYVRSPLFETILMSVRHPDSRIEWVSGSDLDVKYYLDSIDFSNAAILAHNTQFDGSILAWRYGVKPKLWLDTVSMGRAMFGNKGNSLKSLAERYRLPPKGGIVANMMGRTRLSLSRGELQAYAEYCVHDTELCYQLFTYMMEGVYSVDPPDIRDPFPREELRLIDRTLRMFIEPSLHLNVDKLRTHLDAVVAKKEQLMSTISVDRADLMSNPKFAAALVNLGVVPPMKISARTGNETYAFAKTDPGMVELASHPDLRVQTLVAARLGLKSTLEQTRTENFIGIAERDQLIPAGTLPIPLKYCAAHTKRWGGTDGINMQNLPSRGANANTIKSTIEPAEGYVICDADSSNIEARGVAWLAEQHDLVADFANNVDTYAKTATVIYGYPVHKDHQKSERFVGKTVVLGAGYGTGGAKLQVTLAAASPPMHLELAECNSIIQTYRQTYPNIPKLWKTCDKAIQAMHSDSYMEFGPRGLLKVQGRRGILLPSGLYLSYPNLTKEKGDKGSQYEYSGDKGRTKLYGAKLLENITQALARIIIGWQMLRISKRYPVAMTVHDSLVAPIPESEVEQAEEFITQVMRSGPSWAEGWPLDVEMSFGKTYAG